jgi:tetratricopeptide (TPR) repeat protein
VADSITPYNGPHLEALTRIARSARLAVLVGAGTSIACDYPGWGDFLERLEGPLRRKLRDEYLAELRNRDIRTRLDHVASYLEDEYHQLFKETFQPRGDGLGMPEWIRLIFDLPLGLLLTTNYTTELEQVARFHPSSPLGESPEPVRWHDAQGMARAMRRLEGRVQLIYVHGRYDDWCGIERDPQGLEWCRVILGEKSYRYAYEFPGILRERFKAVCQAFTLLVVGASLKDEDLTGTLRFARAVSGAGGPPHYAILPASPLDDPHALGRDYVDRFGLQPIFYEAVTRTDGSVDHTAIGGLLRVITDCAAPAAASQRTTVVGKATNGEHPPQHRIVHPLLRAPDFVPRPTYRHAIESFLVRPEGGVLALVGIGGSGKTAMVADALTGMAGTGASPTFHGVLVWSFYDEPDSAAFLRCLADYARGQPLAEDATEVEAYDTLRRAYRNDVRMLVVMDGLEKLQVQRPDVRRVHGTLESTVLRQFLLWLSQVSGASRAIITTRFPLPDLEAETAGDRVRILEVDALTRPQARALLRRKGVRGEDRELDILLDHFGAHALTVDHLGGVLANYLDGDVTRFRELGEGPLTRFEVGQSWSKLTRVLGAYQKYLAASEPEVQDTLRRVAIFARPVSPNTLGEVFLKPGREKQAGTLAGKKPLDLQRYLTRLASLGLVQRDQSGSVARYSLHPAVREVVLEDLGAHRRGLAGAAREEVETTLDRLALQPNARSRDKATGELLEDLIGLCVEEGEVGRAFNLYWTRLGHYEHTGWRFGEYARGERVARRLIDSASRIGGIDKLAQGLLSADLGLYLETLGRVDEAVRIFYEQIESGLWQETPALSRAFLRLAEALWLAGRMPETQSAASGALERAEAASDDDARYNALWLRGRVALWRGQKAQASADFLSGGGGQAHGRTADDVTRYIVQRMLASFYAHVAWLRSCQRPEEVYRSAQAAVEASGQLGLPALIARSWLVLGETLRHLGDTPEARDFIGRAKEWAVGSGHQEILLWARLFSARLELDEGQIESACDDVSDGLRIADVCGYGLFRIDLRNVEALSRLARGEGELALEAAQRALVMAEGGECDYYWGRLEANESLARIRDTLGEHEKALEHERAASSLKIRMQGIVEVLQPLLSTANDSN